MRAVSGGFIADEFTGAADDPRFYIGVSRKVGRRAWEASAANTGSVPVTSPSRSTAGSDDA